MAQAGDDLSARRVLDLPPAAPASTTTATTIPAAASKMVATCTAASPVSITGDCHNLSHCCLTPVSHVHACPWRLQPRHLSFYFITH